jgi:hypothetical protein
VYGLAALAGATRDLARGTAGRDVSQRIETLTSEVDGRGACRYPDGAIRLLRSALRTFEGDVRAHLDGGACPPAARLGLLPVPQVPEVA